ncbi:MULTISPECIES: FCD domain-containing protein [Helcobacillus]|uniref:DNA-binding GntR family transcriptional regulator n=1 Tax=Helcobacillus massiliensis TaxID=521392 RepID=A0A839R3A7_9MICO|nr:DNA-binding GntR family transcriptional regulator [Helcobacillus massiliensis]
MTATKSERAYRMIQQRIVQGDYLPGDRLKLEHIGEEIGSSVVPVREAIRRLQAEGLVTFEKFVGARVAAIDESEYVHTMETMSVIESAAVALAAPSLTAEQVAEARAVNEQMRDLAAAGDFDAVEFTHLNEQFHRALSHRCPNPHLVMLVDRAWNRLSALRNSTFSFVPDRAAASVEEHERILHLIESGAAGIDIELAMREHRMTTPRAYLARIHADQPHSTAGIVPDRTRLDRTRPDSTSPAITTASEGAPA